VPHMKLDLSSSGLIGGLTDEALSGLKPETTEIDVNGNALTTLPAGCFEKAQDSIESLELYGNKLKEIPAGVLGGLKHLKIINAFNNVIKKLPADIGALVELEEVNFAANKLMMTDDAMFSSWENVKVLNLYDNNLVRMGSLAPLKALEELRISGNNLEEMPILCDDCKVTVYEIHKNRIVKIDADYFEKTKGLERLSIWGNQLAELPASLLKCESLVGLQAQENQLASLPAGTWPASMETVFVQDNKALSKLPKELGACSKLKRVNVKGLSLDAESDQLVEQLKSMVLKSPDGIFWDPKGAKLEPSKK